MIVSPRGVRGFCFVHMMARLTPPWTSALKVATIELKHLDDSEELIMMRNDSVRLRHICQLATMLLSLIADVGRYLGLCLCPSPALAAEHLGRDHYENPQADLAL